MGADRANQEIAQFLAATPYFAGLPPDQLATLAQAASRRKYEAGQTVFLEGEPCEGLYIVQQGWLKAAKFSPGGREQVLHFLSPGEVFNAIGVLAGIPNPATAIALEPTTLWLIRREVLHQLLADHPDLAWNVIQDMAQRILHLVKLVENLSLQTVETRLARLLLEQAADGVIQRRRWATQSEMAARLGTVPDVLSRALRTLVEEGLIAVSRQQIEILDQAGLTEKAALLE